MKEPDGVTDINITSLEEYFNHLRDLVQGPEGIDESTFEAAGGLDAGYLFLKLPLDEPAFEINANERSITVPENYRKNGLSVVGDEVAEIVFFEIDRFFDATDLSIMQITIQWENQKEKGHTPAFIRDIESKATEDKLIFGWPITSDITKYPGTLKFAVRFYQEDDSGIVYSFSTLPQSIVINNSLNLDVLNTAPDDATKLILGRVLNSPMAGIGPASVPVFVFTSPEFTINEQITTPQYLVALASKTDGGSLSYGWFYRNGVDDDVQLTEGSFKSTAEVGMYVPVDEFIPNIITYFYKQGNNYAKLILDETTFEDALEEYVTLYALCTVYELNAENVQAGEYYVNARNLYYSDDAYASEDKTKPLPVWVVAGPLQPAFNAALAAETELGIAIQPNISNGNETSTYAWIRSDDLNGEINMSIVSAEAVYTPVNEGYYRLKVVNSKNNKSYEIISNATLVLGDIAPFTLSGITQTGNTLTVALSRSLERYETVSYKWVNTADAETVLSTEAVLTGITSDATYRVDVIISKGANKKSDAVSAAYIVPSN